MSEAAEKGVGGQELDERNLVLDQAVNKISRTAYYWEHVYSSDPLEAESLYDSQKLAELIENCLLWGIDVDEVKQAISVSSKISLEDHPLYINRHLDAMRSLTVVANFGRREQLAHSVADLLFTAATEPAQD